MVYIVLCQHVVLAVASCVCLLSTVGRAARRRLVRVEASVCLDVVSASRFVSVGKLVGGGARCWLSLAISSVSGRSYWGLLLLRACFGLWALRIAQETLLMVLLVLSSAEVV